MTGSLNDNPGWFQTSDVLDGIWDTFMIIVKPAYPFGTADRHVQAILGHIHTDIDCFLCH